MLSQSCVLDHVYPHFITEETRHREIISLAQAHTARKGHSWDLNQEVQLQSLCSQPQCCIASPLSHRGLQDALRWDKCCQWFPNQSPSQDYPNSLLTKSTAVCHPRLVAYESLREGPENDMLFFFLNQSIQIYMNSQAAARHLKANA